MASLGSSPPPHRHASWSFLPLNLESPSPSNRGALSSLVRTYSSSSLHHGGNQPHWRGRRGSQSSQDADLERGDMFLDGADDAMPESRMLSMNLDNLPSSMLTPQMRSQRLIGNSNARYRWEQYYKTEDELKKLKKPIRKYYERNNQLIQQYMYIDKLLDSSLPHNLIQEYTQPNHNGIHIPQTISEETSSGTPTTDTSGTPLVESVPGISCNGETVVKPMKVKRTPKNLYKVPDEQTPLLQKNDPEDTAIPQLPEWAPEEEADSQDRIVRIAIYVNLAANITLLVLKIVVTIMTSSLSVVASLVDAALDFLSTAIVWVTTYQISQRDPYGYPVGRSRLEPIGVLVFSCIMITSFVQVALEAIQRLSGKDHSLVQLTAPAVAIMAMTVVVKFACWVWCRMIKNSSVQALAQDAMTDVVFNIFSILFPLVGYYAKLWPLDPLGGLLLSLYVIISWSRTSATHIRNLSGRAASADERNVLLYLTMRFAKTIKQIQGCNAYHSGDKLNVEVDLVLDEGISLRDSHDLGESLQYVLESVPGVERAFVHSDYAYWNLPSHMEQREE